MARPREVRAYIYTKNVKFRIPDKDWIWVGLITGPQWMIFVIVDTLIFPMRLFGIIPEWVFTTPAAFVGSIIFFSYIHTGRLEKWFEHNIQARIEASTHRAILPSDNNRKDKVWLLTENGEGLPTYTEETEGESFQVSDLAALRA